MLGTHKILDYHFLSTKIRIYIFKYPIFAVENSLLAQNKIFSKGVKICTYVRNS